MEQTANRLKRRKSAFTLAEFLVVIAIITILAGVSFVAAIRYQRRLRRMEMDHTAKEIFLAAQNQLSLETANGSIERLLAEKKEDSEEIGTPMGEENEGLYYILYQAKADTNDNEGIRNRLLPFGSIDETVRQDGNYVIIYEPEAGTVRAVWYSDQYVFAATDLLSDELAQAAQNADLREQFGTDKKPIGYYVGDTIQNPSVEPPMKLEKVTMELHNEEILYATIYDPNKELESKYDLKFWIEGVSSGAKGSILLTSGEMDTKRFRRVGTSRKYTVVLDDITTEGLRFADLNSTSKKSVLKFQKSGMQFIPGEDVKVYVESLPKGSDAAVAVSTVYQTNSLFQNTTSDKILISNMRHLENLDERVSEFDLLKEDAAEHKNNAEKIGLSISEDTQQFTVSQQSDMSWETFRENVAKLNYNPNEVESIKSQISVFYSISKLGEKKEEKSYDGCYVPVEPKFALSYEGNGHRIQDLAVNEYIKSISKGKVNGISQKVKNYGAGGVFGEIKYDLNVNNVKLVRPVITSGAGVGALIGFGNDPEFEAAPNNATLNIDVENILVQYPMITSNGEKISTSSMEVDAGALIGAFNGAKLTVKKATAINSYREKLSENPEVTDQTPEEESKYRIKSEYGAAGGLIGSVNGSLAVSDCAVSVYVDAKGFAGGLVANVKTVDNQSQQVTIENSYVGGHTANGKFVIDSLPQNEGFDEKQGRYNIVSRGEIAGGLAAILPAGSSIARTYVTASVYIFSTGYAPVYTSFDDKQKMHTASDKQQEAAFVTVYGKINTNSTASVPGKTASAFPYCYSASVVNGNRAVSYAETLKQYFQAEATGEKRAAYPYDKTLAQQYPMPTVIQLIKEDPSTSQLIGLESDKSKTEEDKKPTAKTFSKFVRVHVGDWLEPEKEETLPNGLTLNNGNRLWADYVIDMPTEDGIKFLTFSVKGSRKTVYYLVALDIQNGKVNGAKYYLSTDENEIKARPDKLLYNDWIDVFDFNKNTARRIEIEKSSEKQINVRLYLDNKAFPHASAKYLDWSDDSFIAGEDLYVTASGEHIIPDATDKGKIVNGYFESLIYDSETKTYTAQVANARHLMNLSFYDKSKFNITKVEQTDNILWEEDQVEPKITAKTEPYCTEMLKAYSGGNIKVYDNYMMHTENGSFKAIENTDLYSYDGKGFTIANLKMLSQNNDNGKNASALFVRNAHLTVKNLNLKNPYIVGKQSAAVIIDTVDGNDGKTDWNDTELTLENIKIYGDNTKVQSWTVGGAASNINVHEVAMKNVYFYGKNALIGGSYGSGVAGGLAGRLKADAMTISNCMFSGYISGKHFLNGVGGLIGSLDLSSYQAGPDKTVPLIENCYVAGRNNTYPDLKDIGDDDYLRSRFSISGKYEAGGLIGYGKGTLTIRNSFNMAGVFGYATGNYESGVGGLIGKYENSSKLSLENCYFGGIVKKDAYGSDTSPYIGYLIGKADVKTAATGSALDCKIIGCAYSYDNQDDINPVGSVDGMLPETQTQTSLEKFKIPGTGNPIEAEPYDTNLPKVYPYMIWTRESGKLIYRGDWIQ